MMSRSALVVLALLGASCEPPRSKNPLSDPASARRDARLDGTWAGRVGKDQTAVLHLMPRGDARVDLVIVGNDHDNGAVILAFEGFPSVIAGKSYLNLRARSYFGDYGEKTRLADEWIFARYDFAKDGTLTLFDMEEDPVKAAIQAGKLEGSVAGGNVEVTASSAQLAQFVAAADPMKVWKEFGAFKKQKVETPGPKGRP